MTLILCSIIVIIAYVNTVLMRQEHPFLLALGVGAYKGQTLLESLRLSQRLLYEETVPFPHPLLPPLHKA